MIFPKSSCFLVPHSQTTAIRHPCLVRSDIFLWSRITVPSILFFQNSFRVPGSLDFLHPLWLCQKQPWTNIMALCFFSTISGFPGRFGLLILNRKPRLCKWERIRFSGFVLYPRTLDIAWLRCLEVIKSVMIIIAFVSPNAVEILFVCFLELPLYLQSARLVKQQRHCGVLLMLWNPVRNGEGVLSPCLRVWQSLTIGIRKCRLSLRYWKPPTCNFRQT